jgi:hypothetical protein
LHANDKVLIKYKKPQHSGRRHWGLSQHRRETM